MRALVCPLLALAFATAPAAQNAGLDPSFADGGVAVLDLGIVERASDLALLPDGRLLFAGQAREADGSDDWVVGRLTAQGAPDATFGTDGVVRLDFDDRFDIAERLLPLADGRLVIAGTAEIGGPSAWVLTRHLADGALDTSFGTDGQVRFTDPASNEARLTGAALDAEGRILVTGFSPNSPYLVARFTADGQLDATFGTGGLVSLPFDGIAAVPVALASGQVLVGGRTAFSADTRLVRLDAGGALDASFGTAGEQVLAISPADEEIEWVEELADGRLLVTARADAGPRGNWGLARTTADGTLDATFGIEGVRVIPFNISNFFAEPAPASVQPDGSLVFAGALPGVFLQSDVGLAAFSADGDLDTDLGTLGFVRTDLGQNDRPARLVVQPDGKAVVLGTRFDRSGLSDLFVVRYAADLPETPLGDDLDASFGDDGVVPDGQLVGVQPDGRVVAGFSPLRRFSADGDPDPAFGEGGATAAFPVTGAALTVLGDGALVVTGWENADVDGTSFQVPFVQAFTADGLPLPGFGAEGRIDLPAYAQTHAAGAAASGVTRQPDGKWLVLGRSTNPTGPTPRLWVARLLADGAPDASFGTDGFFYAELSESFVAGGSRLRVLDDGSVIALAEADLVLKLTPAGALDAAFGGGGPLQTAPGVAGVQPRFGSFGFRLGLTGLDVAADGAITVGGAAQGNTLVATRLTPDGQPDPAGVDGRIAEIPVLSFRLTEFLPLPGGGFAWAGGAVTDFNLGSFDEAAVFATPDGLLDAGVGAGGYLRAPTDANVFANSAALQGDAVLISSFGRTVRLSADGGVATEPAPDAPAAARLAAFPNPSSGAVTVRTEGGAAAVRVEVLDVLGRRVALLHDGPALPETLRWAADVSPGVYLIRLVEEQGTPSVRTITVAR